MDARPPADPAKLLSAWSEGETGETPPGRVASNLKTGGLRDLLEHTAAQGGPGVPEDADVTQLLGSWMEWETGATPPAAVLADMGSAGIRALLESLVERADVVVGASEATRDG